MEKALVFDKDRCTGCRLCETICSLVHTETCNPERSRIRIMEVQQGGVEIRLCCQQCEDPFCMAACPVSAIHKNPFTGAIEIDHELCTKCEECLTACPYQAISLDRVEDKVINCDLCGGDPRCIVFCQTRAIEFVEKDSVVIQKKRDALRELEGLLKLAEKY